MIRTEDNCEACVHKEVCRTVKLPTEAVKELNEATSSGSMVHVYPNLDNLDIVVSCVHFKRDFGNTRELEER